MGEVINLNKARKAREKRAAEARAAEHRARFGQTKAAQTKNLKETGKSKSDLDGKRLD